MGGGGGGGGVGVGGSVGLGVRWWGAKLREVGRHFAPTASLGALDATVHSQLPTIQIPRSSWRNELPSVPSPFLPLHS